MEKKGDYWSFGWLVCSRQTCNDNTDQEEKGGIKQKRSKKAPLKVKLGIIRAGSDRSYLNKWDVRAPPPFTDGERKRVSCSANNDDHDFSFFPFFPIFIEHFHCLL